MWPTGAGGRKQGEDVVGGSNRGPFLGRSIRREMRIIGVKMCKPDLSASKRRRLGQATLDAKAAGIVLKLLKSDKLIQGERLDADVRAQNKSNKWTRLIQIGQKPLGSRGGACQVKSNPKAFIILHWIGLRQVLEL